jgi:DNA polymerase-4
MAEGVSGRLRHAGIKAGTVTVKIRDSGFHTVTRQRALTEATDLTEPIWRAAVELARSEVRGKRIRLLGVAASGFDVKDQLGMFQEEGGERRRRVVQAADEVRERFGTRAITRARLLRTGIPAPFERDLGTAVERRGEHAEPVEGAEGRRRKRRDSQADTPPDEDAFDE